MSVAAIELAQKILDRILFIAFAQRTDLLPDRLLKGAAEEVSKYVPKPLWHNFQGLFRAVDEGSGPLNIWGYNGGLFAPDPARRYDWSSPIRWRPISPRSANGIIAVKCPSPCSGTFSNSR